MDWRPYNGLIQIPRRPASDDVLYSNSRYYYYRIVFRKWHGLRPLRSQYSDMNDRYSSLEPKTSIRFLSKDNIAPVVGKQVLDYRQ